MEREMFRVWNGTRMISPGSNPRYLIDPFGDFVPRATLPKIILKYTRFEDRNGVKIFEGDLVNICFTSTNASHIHDGIYLTEFSLLGSLTFRFQKLLWESQGYNQFPLQVTLSDRKHLDYYFSKKENRSKLAVVGVENYTGNPAATYPFNDSSPSFSSQYFEVIGNKFENPELLKEER